MIDSWKETTLGEVIELYDHKRIPLNTRQRSERQGEYPYYGAAGIIDSVDDYIFDGKYLLIAEDGSVMTEYGKPILQLVNGKFWVSNHAHVVQGKTPISTEFLYFTLSNVSILGYLTGTAQPKLSQTNLKSIKLSLPPTSVQRKITSILSAYDDLIENNTRRIKILEDIAQTLYQEWFVHFRFPGHENVPMVESPLGPIPKGWEIGEFGDIVENVKEKVKPGKHLGHLSYVPIDCIPRRSISLMEHKPYSEAKSSLIAFKQNDILFGAMRPYFHKVIFAPFDGITRQTCFVLRSKNSSSYPFDLFTAFQDSTVQYSSNRSTGSTIPYATWNHALAEMPIVRPPNLLIERFSDVVIPMLNSIRMMLEKNANLRQTRDLLLPKLISGEIDVSELDIDPNGIQPERGGTHIPYPLTNRLHADEKILGGKPVIRGTRLAVAFILDLLKQGWSEEEVVENYPSVAHEDIEACRVYEEKVVRASVSR